MAAGLAKAAKAARHLLRMLLHRNDDEGNGGKVAMGCGCLAGIFCLPFLSIVLFILIIMWLLTSMFSCTAEIVLEDVLGIPISAEDEQMIKNEFSDEKDVYQQIESYFAAKGSADQACYAQSFYLLYRDASWRNGYLDDLYYCFADGVKARTVQRVEERFGIVLSDDNYEMIQTYARSTRLDTAGYRTDKNGADLATFAVWAADHMRYLQGTYGTVLSFDQVYQTDDMDLMMKVGWRTCDNIGLYRAYAWLDKDSGEITPTTAGAELVSMTDTAADVLAKAAQEYEIDALLDIGEPGFGLYDTDAELLGIYIGDGDAVYASVLEDKIVREPVSDGGWDVCFRFYGLQYLRMDERTVDLRITVYSELLTSAFLLIDGNLTTTIPLHFTDGVAVVEITLPAGDLWLQLLDSTNTPLQGAYYGEWEQFTAIGGEYYDIELVAD